MDGKVVKYPEILGYGTISKSFGYVERNKAYHYLYALTEEGVRALNDDHALRAIRTNSLRASIARNEKEMFKMEATADGDRSYLESQNRKLSAELSALEERICRHCGATMKPNGMTDTWRVLAPEARDFRYIECPQCHYVKPEFDGDWPTL